MFVSERPGEGTCDSGPGFGDIYIVRRNAAVGWGEPRHLGCVETGTGPNSAGAEFSPSLVSTDEGTFLYFSSTCQRQSRHLPEPPPARRQLRSPDSGA